MDGLTYRFELVDSFHGKPRWRRVDFDLRLYFSLKAGWVIGDDSGNVLARPWDDTEEEDKLLPPVGTWVSCKGAKSYVYSLIYIWATT